MNTCDGPHYSCGETETWSSAGTNTNDLIQLRDNQRSFDLGSTTINVARQKRTFKINTFVSSGTSEENAVSGTTSDAYIVEILNG